MATHTRTVRSTAHEAMIAGSTRNSGGRLLPRMGSCHSMNHKPGATHLPMMLPKDGQAAPFLAHTKLCITLDLPSAHTFAHSCSLGLECGPPSLHPLPVVPPSSSLVPPVMKTMTLTTAVTTSPLLLTGVDPLPLPVPSGQPPLEPAPAGRKGARLQLLVALLLLAVLLLAAQPSPPLWGTVAHALTTLRANSSRSTTWRCLLLPARPALPATAAARRGEERTEPKGGAAVITWMTAAPAIGAW